MNDFKHPPGLEIAKFYYLAHTTKQGGLLPNVLGAHACWHYARNAMQHLEKLDEGATYVGDPDQRWGLDAVMHATQIMYEIEDRETIMVHMRNVKAEAARCGLPFDDRLFNPVSQEKKGNVIIMPSEKFARHIEATRNRHGDINDESE